MAQVDCVRPMQARSTRACALVKTSDFQLPVLTCWDDSGLSTSVNLTSYPTRVATGPNIACWVDAYGFASCSNGATAFRVRDVQVSDDDQIFFLFNDSGALSSTANTPFQNAQDLGAGEYATAVELSPNAVCLSLPYAAQPFACSSTVDFPPQSSFTTYTFPVAPVKLVPNSSLVFWLGGGTLSAFGIPPCDGSNGSFCASQSYDAGLVEGSYGAALDFSSGLQQLCWVNSANSITCVGSSAQDAPVASFSQVSVFDSGACGLYDGGLSFSCWGSITGYGNLYTSVQCGAEDIVFQDLCFKCPFGFGLDTLTSSWSCAECAADSVRGLGDVACIPCGEGSQSSLDRSTCSQCADGFFSSASMLSCSVCPAGSQSSLDKTSCVGCTAPYVRAGGVGSCSTCAQGSMPNESLASCSACPEPFVWSQSSIGATYFSQGTCVRCPDGFGASAGSCSLCEGATVRRSSQTTCTACPTGFEANALHTECVACSENTIRTQFAPQCYECPTGTLANDSHTECVGKAKTFFLSQPQIALYAVGVLLMLASGVLRKELGQELSYGGIALAVLLILAATLLFLAK